MPVRSFYWTPDNRLQRDLSEAQITQALERRDGLLWVDIGETKPQDGEFLRRVFGFHPLAVEDCVSPLVHFPKVDDFGDHLFLIFHGVDYASTSDLLETTELALFLGKHYVVSNHDYPMAAVDSLVQRIEQGAFPIAKESDSLAHVIIDALVDHVLPMMDRMAEVAEAVEQAALEDPRRETLDAIRRLKRSTLRLLRIMEPQREVLSLLSRGAYPLVRPEARIYYRDIYDHLARITDLNHTLREVADDALETYLTSVSNRQNETIKVLTGINIVFLPIILIASFYGMNFDYLPGLHWRYSYLVVVGVMAGAGLGALLWFVAGHRRRGEASPKAQDLRLRPPEPGALAADPRTLAKRLKP